MLKFDAATTRDLDAAYSGSDFSRWRRVSFEALDPRPGESILDIGCGNGMLTGELARSVGSGGRIVGIDPSVKMLDAARRRCAEFGWVELRDAVAEALPAEDGSFQKAIAIQVLEFVDDLGAALGEASRVLRKGGRLVVADVHFGSWIWYSAEPARMRRMMAAWENHVAEQGVPELLPALLTEAGFTDVRVEPVTICDHVLRPDGLAAILMRQMRSYVVGDGLIPAGEARAWADEQEALARDGKFFSSLTQYVLSATRR